MKEWKQMYLSLAKNVMQNKMWLNDVMKGKKLVVGYPVRNNLV